jgi:hypothetical protein
MMRNLEIERVALPPWDWNHRRCVDEMKKYSWNVRPLVHETCLILDKFKDWWPDSYAEYVALRSTVSPARLDPATAGNGLDADGIAKLQFLNMSKQVADRSHSSHGRIRHVGEYKVERFGVTPSFWRQVVLTKVHKNMCRDLRKMGSTRLD